MFRCSASTNYETRPILFEISNANKRLGQSQPLIERKGRRLDSGEGGIDTAQMSADSHADGEAVVRRDNRLDFSLDSLSHNGQVVSAGRLALLGDVHCNGLKILLDHVQICLSNRTFTRLATFACLSCFTEYQCSLFIRENGKLGFETSHGRGSSAHGSDQN